jgi:hypothetical protein
MFTTTTRSRNSFILKRDLMTQYGTAFLCSIYMLYPQGQYSCNWLKVQVLLQIMFLFIL